MPTNAELLRAYTARGLQLIRVGNGLDSAAQKELTALALAIRRLLAETPPATAGTRALTAMLGDIEASIIARYAEISAAQIASQIELAGIEAEFARRVGNYANAPSRQALARAMSSMLFLGNTPQANWDHAAQQLAFRVGAAVRDAAATGADEAVVRAQVLGTGPTNRGGLIEGARREASRLTDAGVQSSAGIGRAATWRANGVNAVRWHAILDPKVCPDCGMRAGKLYTLDAEPIGHSVPMVREPPLHWNCRCMLVAQKFKGGVPDDSGPEGESFARYLESLSEDEQDALLGKGRAKLWRSGTITLRDLIGQGGQVMTVGELRDSGRFSAYDEAKAGGKHAGFLKRLGPMKATQVAKSIRSHERRIVEHLDKIADPLNYVRADLPELELRALIEETWPKEIRKFEEEIEIARRHLEGRGNG